jgi:predicted RNA binding protein YcfA (HicA-like mRNA interferase family)
MRYSCGMTKKLLARLLSKPKDVTWGELVKVLAGFGFKQITGGKAGGSRVRFIHRSYPPVILVKPHPQPIIKRYILDNVIDLLRQEKLI